MLWAPSVSAEVLNVAWSLPLRVCGVPNGALPSKKETVPVGVPAPGAVAETVAVNVPCCTTADGVGAEITTVVDGPLLTVCVPSAAVLPWQLASPLYAARMTCFPSHGT